MARAAKWATRSELMQRAASIQPCIGSPELCPGLKISRSRVRTYMSAHVMGHVMTNEVFFLAALRNSSGSSHCQAAVFSGSGTSLSGGGGSVAVAAVASTPGRWSSSKTPRLYSFQGCAHILSVDIPSAFHRFHGSSVAELLEPVSGFFQPLAREPLHPEPCQSSFPFLGILPGDSS